LIHKRLRHITARRCANSSGTTACAPSRTSPPPAELDNTDIGPWFTTQQKKMSLEVDGRALFTRETRFARPGWESPEGEFRIWHMNSDTIFGERTPMPCAIFYQGNVAIHYSDDFNQVGYEGGSHGCSQLKDYQVAKWLYEQVKVGDKVVVY
jgi:hypothetical protein